jgi:hypothetical protein
MNEKAIPNWSIRLDFVYERTLLYFEIYLYQFQHRSYGLIS